MTPEQISVRLSGRKTPAGWQARCPAHEDHKASLSVSEGGGGKVLLNCHAGCKFEDIVGAAGLTPNDLFADDAKPSKRPEVVAEYNYLSEAGELLYQAVRLEPKGFRQRRPEGTGWNWSTKGVRRVLYRLPELVKLKPGTAVFVVEGEKDADALVALGLQATTNAGGADKWSNEFAQQLVEMRVVILPDNDEPGRKHGKRVAKSLKAVNAKHVVLELPDLPEKGDVSDWLANGGDREQLQALAKNLFHEAAAIGFASSASRLHDANELRKANIKRVMPYNVSYLDDELLGIHPNDIIIIMAATGAGKTTLGSLLASHAARAGRSVAFFALEAYQNEIELRDLYRTVVTLAKEQKVYQPWMTQQRWIKEGIAELEPFVEPCIQFLQKKLATLHTFYRSTSFNKEDIRREFLALKDKADLIVLDHIHYVDTDGPNENAELKNIIKAIRDCGQQLDIPVIVIAHIRKRGSNSNKKQMLPTVDDLHGTSDISKMATAIIAVSPARDEEFRSDDPEFANTFMAVIKDRIGGDKGYAALMRFSLTEMNYKRQYRLCRRLPDGSAELADRRPGWARGAVRA